jgi:putative FmdB family regulatory protein
MPIYEYRCEKGHTFEVMQRMSDPPVTECQVCGAPVQRVFHPIAVHFKGSGFYNTDYGKQKRGGASASSEDSGGGDSKKDSNSKPDGASSSSSSDGGSGSKTKETSSSGAAAKSSSSSD